MPTLSTSHQKNQNAIRLTDTPSESGTLNRSMTVWHSFTMGFAVVSPVVGLYAIIGVQTAVTGGGWSAALAICLIMQLLVATVYAELASQFPIAGGAYKWARQLGGAITGQYAGVIYVSSTIAMLTTTAYTGGIWLAGFWGALDNSGLSMVLWGGLFLLLCTLLNLAHANIFKTLIALGVYAEIIGSFGIALLLFFFFRQHGFSELFQHLGSGSAPTETAAFLAALAIAGWAFIGFDSCSTTAEETHQPKRMPPRARASSACASSGSRGRHEAAPHPAKDRTRNHRRADRRGALSPDLLHADRPDGRDRPVHGLSRDRPDRPEPSRRRRDGFHRR